MKVTTNYKSNANGTGQIVARCNGKQKTVTYDQSKSSDWNHGAAAGTLIVKMVQDGHTDDNRVADYRRSVVSGHATHTSNDSGTAHRFDI